VQAVFKREIKLIYWKTIFSYKVFTKYLQILCREKETLLVGFFFLQRKKKLKQGKKKRDSLSTKSSFLSTR